MHRNDEDWEKCPKKNKRQPEKVIDALFVLKDNYLKSPCNASCKTSIFKMKTVAAEVPSKKQLHAQVY